MKKVIALLLAAVLALGLLAGCSKDGAEGTNPTGTAPAENSGTGLNSNANDNETGDNVSSSGDLPEELPATDGDLSTNPVIPASDGDLAAADHSDVTMALVVAGTFGDRSFYDSSKEGADKLASTYGINVRTIECNNVDHTQQIYNAADAAEIVVLVGWEFYDVETIAPEYPEVHFIWIDNATSAPVENVLNITYAQNEGSFLAGYIAAKMSESGVIGAVGGEDTDTINDFVVGYKQGAQYANPDVKVETIHAGTYDDPAKGKECALALQERGADVIFQIASKTGDGVFQAAQEEGFYAIGVDSDQKYIADDVIICSMMKRVNDSIVEAVSEYLAGDTSKWGTTWIADMATGFIGIGYGDETATQQISDELKTEVDELAKKIVAGEITVETTR